MLGLGGLVAEIELMLERSCVHHDEGHRHAGGHGIEAGSILSVSVSLMAMRVAAADADALDEGEDVVGAVLGDAPPDEQTAASRAMAGTSAR
jgi:hypothetical protein